MKIPGIGGGVLYTGGKFKTYLHSGKVFEDEPDCDKVNDVLDKYGKANVRTIEYIDENSKVTIIYNRKAIL